MLSVSQEEESRPRRLPGDANAVRTRRGRGRGPTFGGLEEADAGLDLGPVLVLLLRGVFHHQLVELHRDDVMVVWK